MCLGIPGRITEIRNREGLPVGTVDFGGVRREVCLAYVADEVEVGDYAIVHVGFAISKVDEDEARRTFAVLREMSQLDELGWMAEVADMAEGVPDPPASRPGTGRGGEETSATPGTREGATTGPGPGEGAAVSADGREGAAPA